MQGHDAVAVADAAQGLGVVAAILVGGALPSVGATSGLVIFSDVVTAQLLIPYTRGDIISYLCEKANVLEKEYREDGTLLSVKLSCADYGRLKDYDIVQNNTERSSL